MAWVLTELTEDLFPGIGIPISPHDCMTNDDGVRIIVVGRDLHS
jgi:hypothetical protein